MSAERVPLHAWLNFATSVTFHSCNYFSFQTSSIQCTQNLGFAVLSIVGGEIVDNHGYMVLEVSFSVQLCITLIAAILLYVLDASSSHGGKLNLSAWARKRRKQSQETEAAQRSDIFFNVYLVYKVLRGATTCHIYNPGCY